LLFETCDLELEPWIPAYARMTEKCLKQKNRQTNLTVFNILSSTSSPLHN
jgi:hypothetical protein